MATTFSDQLRGAIVAALKAKGLSRYELAKRLGCGQSFLSDLVLGKSWVGEEMANKLARALDLRVVTTAKKRRS